MKTKIIRLGFFFWRLVKRNGSGRRIVDADQHKTRRHIAFHVAMMVRAMVITLESDSPLGAPDWR